MRTNGSRSAPPNARWFSESAESTRLVISSRSVAAACRLDASTRTDSGSTSGASNRATAASTISAVFPLPGPPCTRNGRHAPSCGPAVSTPWVITRSTCGGQARFASATSGAATSRVRNAERAACSPGLVAMGSIESRAADTLCAPTAG